MKGGMNISMDRPACWDSICTEHRRWFQSFSWHQILERGLGSTTYYLSDRRGWLASVTVFRAGPFRIAYCGFPIGGPLRAPDDNLPFSGADFAALLIQAMRGKADTLRIYVSGFDPAMDLAVPGIHLPETAICNLQQWNAESLPASTRRNIRKADREGVVVTAATPSDTEAIWGMYQQTIEKHGGLRRYTRQYFAELISLSGNSDLRVTLAKRGACPLAYMVTVGDRDTRYYWHGGLDSNYQHLRPTEAVYLEAIQHAKSAGYRSFNLLDSPSDQPTLTRYKEKWGGVTRLSNTYMLDINPLRAKLFDYAVAIYRRLHAG